MTTPFQKKLNEEVMTNKIPLMKCFIVFLKTAHINDIKLRQEWLLNGR